MIKQCTGKVSASKKKPVLALLVPPGAALAKKRLASGLQLIRRLGACSRCVFVRVALEQPDKP